MLSSYTLRHRVEFADTDMAGMMHFANFFRYMEITEHAFYRSLGYPINSHSEYGWVRAEASCLYKKPLRVDDEVDVQLLVAEIEDKHIKYDFYFGRVTDKEKNERVAEGHITVVCIRFSYKASQVDVVHIPVDLAQKIKS